MESFTLVVVELSVLLFSFRTNIAVVPATAVRQRRTRNAAGKNRLSLRRGRFSSIAVDDAFMNVVYLIGYHMTS